MVTSQKMIENEMDYRGSKSEIKLPQPKQISVKEQRVDGSWYSKTNKKGFNVFKVYSNGPRKRLSNQNPF